MIIRNEQIEAMRLELFRSMCTRLTQRLLSDLDLRGSDASRITREVQEIIHDVAAIGIRGEENAYRLLRFRFLAESVLTSPLLQSVVLRVLHNLAWSVDERLAFLEREVLPRVRSGATGN